MSDEKRAWLNPETSYAGVAVMVGAGLVTAYIGTQYVELPYLLASLVASIVAIVVGIVWNIIAHVRGTKKIHWLDFIFFNLLPW